MKYRKCCDNPKITQSTGCPSCWTCDNCKGFGCSNQVSYFSDIPEIKIEFPSNIESCKPIVPSKEFFMKKDQFVYVYCDDDNNVVEVFKKFEDAKAKVIECWGEYEEEPIEENEDEYNGCVCQCHEYVSIYKKKIK